MSSTTRKTNVFAKLLAPLAAMLVVLASAPSLALGPHEILLVVNDESVDSILLGDVYQRLRAIPDCNVVRLSIPESVYDGMSTDMSPENFTRYIWDPMQAAIDRAGIRSQVLACVFSCGFPTRITTAQRLSLTGAVFLKNRFPADDQVKNGMYVSELFAGPPRPGSRLEPSSTFDNARNRLLESMPFPAMMLAFTGINGISVSDAVDALERSAAADYTSPKGMFYFEVNDDVRTKCRLWEYEPVAKAINAMSGFSAIVSTAPPAAKDFPLCGFMTGAVNYRTDALAFHPGAYADNLTSFGGTFGHRGHTKATSWLKSGAAFSSGTVTEPLAIWTKFAHACIFLHQLDGCTAIESFYQSARSPLQILPLGDPLANPWAPRIEPVIKMPEGKLSGLVDMQVSVKGERPDEFYRFQWLVDGKVVATGRSFVWNSPSVSNGRHTIRAVARRQRDSIRQQGFFETSVVVSNGGGK